MRLHARRWTKLAEADLGLVAGFAIGVVAAVMGVPGGEVLIPTIVSLYGMGIKLPGSLSRAVPLPTMLVACARYSASRPLPVAGKVGSCLP